MKLRISDLAFVSFIVVICMLYALGPSNPSMCWVSSYALTWTVGGIVTPFSVLYLLKRWRLHEGMKQFTIISLALGVYLLFQAEIVYAFYTLVLKVELPYPSWGDAFRIAGQLLLLSASYSILKWTEYFRKSKLRILNILVSLGLGLVVLGIVIMPVLMDINEVTLATVTMLTYPLIDVLLFSSAFAGSIILFQSYRWKRWTPIPFGFLLFLIGDIGFSILKQSGAYFFGHPIEAFYLIGEVTVAYGCFQVGSQSIDLRTMLQHTRGR